jgi:hypothetical protein
VSQQSLEGARLQARLQVTSEAEGRIRYELLDPSTASIRTDADIHGTCRIPAPGPPVRRQ